MRLLVWNQVVLNLHLSSLIILALLYLASYAYLITPNSVPRSHRIYGRCGHMRAEFQLRDAVNIGLLEGVHLLAFLDEAATTVLGFHVCFYRFFQI